MHSISLQINQMSMEQCKNTQRYPGSFEHTYSPKISKTITRNNAIKSYQ